MFEQMEIAEYIYEVVVEPSYKTHWGSLRPCWSQHSKYRRNRLITYSLRDG